MWEEDRAVCRGSLPQHAVDGRCLISRAVVADATSRSNDEARGTKVGIRRLGPREDVAGAVEKAGGLLDLGGDEAGLPPAVGSLVASQARAPGPEVDLTDGAYSLSARLDSAHVVAIGFGDHTWEDRFAS